MKEKKMHIDNKIYRLVVNKIDRLLTTNGNKETCILILLVNRYII